MSRGRKVPSELQRLLDTSPDAVLLVARAGAIVALTSPEPRRCSAPRPEGSGESQSRCCSPNGSARPMRSARAAYTAAPTVRAMSARSGLMGCGRMAANSRSRSHSRRCSVPPGWCWRSCTTSAPAPGSRRRSACTPGKATEALDAIPDPVFITDATGSLDSQSGAEELTGQPLASARGRPLERSCRSSTRARAGVRSPSRWPPASSARRADRGPGRGAAAGARTRAADVGRLGGPAAGFPGATTGAAVVARDVTRARRIAEELAHQATHDALTGLVNRPEFERRLARALASSETGHGEHAVCFLDLDGFKTVNDACGHLAGDELLRQLSDLMRDRMRARDTLARLGGDEFGLPLEHCGLARAARVAGKIREAITDHRFTLGEVTYGIWGERRDRPDPRRSAWPACPSALRTPPVMSPSEPGEPHPGARPPRTIRQRGPLTPSGCAACDVPPNRTGSDCTPSLWWRSAAEPRAPAPRAVAPARPGAWEVVPPSGFLPTARRHGLMPRVDAWVVRRAVQDWPGGSGRTQRPTSRRGDQPRRRDHCRGSRGAP